MTITDVSELLMLSWDQVKTIDKSELKKRYATINTQGLTTLCVDEISIKKHHHYLTIIANYQTGHVLGVMKDRNYYSLANFLKKLPIKVRENIQAVAMDMWDPYIKAVQEYCPKAHIVFDFFHVVAAFSRVIDKIRNQHYRDADSEKKKLMKKSRFLLLKNPHNLKADERPRLKQILKQNQTLAHIYILKEYLKRLWQYKYSKCAHDFFLYWCQLALDTKCKELYKFVKMLFRYSYGIINHCKFQIHTSKLEGINNKIKVMKRKAYGYRDLEYFSLKIIQATCN
jgi:transposase